MDGIGIGAGTATGGEGSTGSLEEDAVEELHRRDDR
jgi:hypothetical protein